MAENTDRQRGILGASSALLLKYGLRKVSMDDVAKAAGISRPGLYLHYPNKDALFVATIDYLRVESKDAARTALTNPERSLESRIVDAFAAMAGETLATNLDEVFEQAERLTGQPATELEATIIAEFTAALDATSTSASWRRNGDSAQTVATLLYATSAGLKRLARSRPDYLEMMRRAVDLIFTPVN